MSFSTFIARLDQRLQDLLGGDPHDRDGVGAILSKNYSQGVTDILQALTLIFGGAAVVGLRHAVAKVPDRGPRRGRAPRLSFGTDQLPAAGTAGVGRAQRIEMLRSTGHSLPALETCNAPVCLFDLVLYLFAIVLLIPLVMRLVESMLEAFGPAY